MIRSGLPIQQAVAEVVANDPVTHDMRHLVLQLIEPTELKFFPGQYVDIAVPGTEATRSFSMANTSSRESGQLEFVIKVYPDGLFSHFLDTELAVGDRLDLTGPFGVFTLREAATPTWSSSAAGPGWRRSCRCCGRWPSAASTAGDLLLRRARASATSASRRSCAALEERLPNFRYVPALSEPAADDDWDGEVGLITDVVQRHETDLTRRRRLRLRAAADGRGGDADARRPRRRRRSTSTTTSSPPPVTPATRRCMEAGTR